MLRAGLPLRSTKVTDLESVCEQVISSGGEFSFKNSRAVKAYPDISANGANCVIAVDGSFSLVFGTSASTSVAGSIITLVNDAKLAIGKKHVGFINPAVKFHLACLMNSSSDYLINRIYSHCPQMHSVES
ncbi:hypothetical protein M422DRAFT_43470 [Sphaerobolus stellatus SS14]|nr:hypothetical protein M422DRAFT_43470 [Sphaerobolus stellatus SS14]